MLRRLRTLWRFRRFRRAEKKAAASPGEAKMGLLHCLRVQGRVLSALMLREIHTINGKDRLGYLWVLAQSFMSIFMFWFIRSMLKFHPPHGMPQAFYLAVGFGVWYTFVGIVNKCLVAESANRNLLSFPQVTLVDVLVARMIVIWATQLIATLIFIAMAVLLGYTTDSVNVGGLLLVLLLVPIFSFGVGCTLANILVFVPILEKVIPYVIQVMFFMSGVFFSVDRFPQKYRAIFSWNPVLQLIEWMRACVCASYTTTIYKPAYVVVLTLAFLVVSLLTNQYTRVYAAKRV